MYILPTLPPILNKSHPIARDLIFDAPLGLFNGRGVRDLVTNLKPTYGGSPDQVVGKFGRATRFDSSGEYLLWNNHPLAAKHPFLTMQMIMVRNSSGESGYGGWGGLVDGAGATPDWFFVGNDNFDGGWGIRINTFYEDIERVYSHGYPTNNIWQHYIYSYDHHDQAADDLDVWKNNAVEGLTLRFNQGWTEPITTNAFIIGNGTDFTSYMGGSVALFRFWKRRLLPREVRDLMADPWLLYRRPLTIGKSAGITVISLTDSGVGSDALTIQNSFTVTDAGSDAESISITSTLNVADKGEGGESGPILHSNDFSSDNLSTYYDTPAGSWSIAGGVLSNTGGGFPWNSRVLITKKNDYKDFEIYCRLKKPLGKNTQVIFRTGGDNNGYGIQIRTDGTDSNFRLEHWGISLLVNVNPLAWVDNNWYRVRIRAEGNRIRARVWEDDKPEPRGTWHIDYTGTNFSTGAIGFSAEDANADYDDLMITSIDPQIVAGIPISDTGGLASEVLSIFNSLTILESSAASEVITILAQIALSDSSNAVEAVSVLTDIVISDTGNLSSETLALLIQVAVSDMGASSEAVTALVDLAVQDTGVGDEVVSALASILLQDTVSSGETIDIVNSFMVSDSGNGSELISILVQIALSDSGVNTEALAVLAQLLMTDTGAASEVLTILNDFTIADAANGAEVISILTQFLLSDEGSGVEAINILTQLVISESVLSNEAISALISVALSDNSNAIDALTTLVLIATSDSGIASEVITRSIESGLWGNATDLYDLRGKLYNKSSEGLYSKK